MLSYADVCCRMLSYADESEHLEDYIRRFGAKFSHAAQAQDKRKKLERINLNRVEPPTDLETVEVCLRILTYAHVCSRVLTYADVWKRLLTSKPLRYASSLRPHTLVA
jgi:hypothetical protein